MVHRLRAFLEQTCRGASIADEHVSIGVAQEQFPLNQPFRISRGAKNVADVLTVSITNGSATGRGECVPYARYGETISAVQTELQSACAPLSGTRLENVIETAEARLTSMAARNAVDCALYDFVARANATSVAAMIGLEAMHPVPTFVTLSLDTPEAMATAARNVPASTHCHLKLKLGGALDADRMRAVSQARPDATLIGDANEAWSAEKCETLLQAAAEAGFDMIEQPLPAERDSLLATINRPLPVCADEAAHTSETVSSLADRYDAVNIKLDKTGGLTGALAMVRAAEAAGLKIMVGSMVASSLSMAPAFLVAQHAEWVDLDSPALLRHDRPHAMSIRDGVLQPPHPDLWQVQVTA